MTTNGKPTQQGRSAESILAFGEVELLDYLDHILAHDNEPDDHNYGVPDQRSNTVNRSQAGATANHFTRADRFLKG